MADITNDPIVQDLATPEQLNAEAMQKLQDEIVTLKGKLNQSETEIRTLKQDLAKRDVQLETLGKASKDNEELQRQIKDLQEANRLDKEEAARQRKIDLIKLAIAGDDEYNVAEQDIVVGLLDVDNIEITEKGELKGFQKERNRLIKERPLFWQPKTAPEQDMPPQPQDITIVQQKPTPVSIKPTVTPKQEPARRTSADIAINRFLTRTGRAKTHAN